VKTRKPAKAPLSSDKPSDYLAAGYQIVSYASGSLLLRKGSDLRLFHFTEHREGGHSLHGHLAVSFVARVP
jgi:membrane-bound metal-dependent hydrolase YbcI (DUF457 family)